MSVLQEGYVMLGGRVWRLFGFMRGEERFDVLGADPVGAANAHRLELALMDEPLHVSAGNLEQFGDFSGGENFGF